MNPDVILGCTVTSLWNGTHKDTVTITKCQKIWDTHITRYTWVGGPSKPVPAMKLTSWSLCFRGNRTISVGRNTGCNTTIHNSDIQRGTSSLMDSFW